MDGERAEQEEAHVLSVHEPGDMPPGQGDCGRQNVGTDSCILLSRREEEGGANLVNPIRMVSLFLAET